MKRELKISKKVISGFVAYLKEHEKSASTISTYRRALVCRPYWGLCFRSELHESIRFRQRNPKGKSGSDT